jgi:hypothetical protein
VSATGVVGLGAAARLRVRVEDDVAVRLIRVAVQHDAAERVVRRGVRKLPLGQPTSVGVHGAVLPGWTACTMERRRRCRTSGLGRNSAYTDGAR